MRLWSLHPRYLDARGLAAVWREALLAQQVLNGQTRGYRHHPQLARFRAFSDPTAAIATYLAGLLAEAQQRGYSFAADKVGAPRTQARLPVTRGQLAYEWEHLMAKLAERDPARHKALLRVAAPGPEPHPLFCVVEGEVEPWEKRR